MGFQDDRQARRIDTALLLLRLTFGGLMLYSHGWVKIAQLFGHNPIRFADPLGLGIGVSFGLVVFAEVICSLLIIIGLFTRWATIPLIATMLVAIFIVHVNDHFSKIEFALLYLMVFITLTVTGPGRYSIDSILRRV